MWKSSSGNRQFLGSLFWSIVAILFGWTLFIFWWIEVARSKQIGVFIDLLVALAVLVAVLGLGTALWISHNQRIARKGKRGKSTRFVSAQPVRDKLDRSLLLPARLDLTTSQRIVIRADEQTKRYSIDRKTEASVERKRETV